MTTITQQNSTYISIYQWDEEECPTGKNLQGKSGAH